MHNKLQFRKYYYGHDNGILTEKCEFNKFKNCMIGSTTCSECIFNDDLYWIKCKKIPQGGKYSKKIIDIGTINLYEN